MGFSGRHSFAFPGSSPTVCHILYNIYMYSMGVWDKKLGRSRPWHIRLALKRALCIVVSTEHYLSTIQHLLIIFNHMLPDRLGEGSVRTFVRVVSADITYLDEMYGESGYQMLLSTFRAPGNEPSQISAQNYLAQLLRGKSFRNIMSIFMSIFLLNQSVIG